MGVAVPQETEVPDSLLTLKVIKISAKVKVISFSQKVKVKELSHQRKRKKWLPLEVCAADVEYSLDFSF